MACSMKRKQVHRTMEQKLSALKRLEKGESLSKVALYFGVGRSTIGDWKKKRAEIESWCFKRNSSDTLKKRKTMKESDFHEVSEALYSWFRQQRANGTPMSGPILQEKALQLYEELGKGETTFGASAGWLDRWKKRYGVGKRSLSGDKFPSDCENSSEQFSGDRIYNCDETVLKLGVFPENPLSGEDQSVPRKSKEKVTNNEDDITQWMKQDTTDSPLSDDDNIEHHFMMVKEENLSEEDETVVEDTCNSEEEHKMSHSEGLKAFEDALRYLEQQGASHRDLLLLGRLRDRAVRSVQESNK